MEIKRIIVSRTDKIGDLILSIPSFFMIKKMYPEAEIIVLVKKYNYEIVKNLKYIDRILKIDDYTRKNLEEKIAYYKADVFIALYSDNYICSLAKKSGAKIKIGPLSKLKSFITYNRGIFQRRSVSKKNEAEYNLDLIKKLDPNRYNEVYELNTDLVLDGTNREIGYKFYKDFIKKESKVIVINPFTGGSAKNLTLEQYRNLVKRLVKLRNDIEIIILAHISQEEEALSIINGIERTHVFPNGGPLLNIAAIIEKSNLYIGGSTGPTHMAGALKKKIVAIYPNKKTQNPTRWGVFGKNIDVEYLIPDINNKKENYSHKNFDSYNPILEDILIEIILRKLER